MGRYYVKVVGKGDQAHILANLPSGVFTRGPMEEQQAMEEARRLRATMEKEKRVPWWKKIFGWRTADQQQREDVYVPPSSGPPTCPRHPRWTAERAGDKWVCGFCRKELNE
jgi:hypothetical protein